MNARLRKYCFVAAIPADLIGYPVVDVKVNVLDFRHNDPPDPAVPLLGTLTLALREAITQAQTTCGPVMNLEVRVPEEFLGAIMKDLGSRRTEIRETDMSGGFAVVRGLVPLSENVRILHTDAVADTGTRQLFHGALRLPARKIVDLKFQKTRRILNSMHFGSSRIYAMPWSVAACCRLCWVPKRYGKLTRKVNTVQKLAMIIALR